MYFGKLTDELIEVAKEYYSTFEYDFLSDIDFKYYEEDHDKLIRDMREAIKKKEPLLTKNVKRVIDKN